MTRYYYTDPLAAAWMARHHGMKLYIGHLPDDFDAYSAINWHHCVDDWRYRQEKLKQPAPKFYIHPDSLHLLEPQDDDMVSAKINGNTIVGYWSNGEIWNDDSTANTHFGSFAPENVTVIQRNGIAFMWPESEAV